MIHKQDILVIGAGIFGLTAAIELRQRGHQVTVINPGTIPHTLAASTDISKAVRMEYGSDLAYMAMAEEAIDGWHAWNDLFGSELYHEVGFILATRWFINEDPESWEWQSYVNLLKRGYQPQRLDTLTIKKQYPAFNNEQYIDGFFNPRAGYVEAARVLKALLKYAQGLQVTIHERQTAEPIRVAHGRIMDIETREGSTFSSGHVIVCAGPYTPYLVPDLQPYMRATGHPVFHLQVSRPDLFYVPKMAVFTADITKTGWYGFPYHTRVGAVKIANHGIGKPLNPETDPRMLTHEDIRALRLFLADTFPDIKDDPIAYKRLCVYTDTLDGHFWIDRHPEIEGLTIGSGGSGHGLKMAPILGRLIAAAAEGGQEKWSAKFHWRHLTVDNNIEEEARFQ